MLVQHWRLLKPKLQGKGKGKGKAPMSQLKPQETKLVSEWS